MFLMKGVIAYLLNYLYMAEEKEYWKNHQVLLVFKDLYIKT